MDNQFPSPNRADGIVAPISGVNQSAAVSEPYYKPKPRSNSPWPKFTSLAIGGLLALIVLGAAYMVYAATRPSSSASLQQIKDNYTVTAVPLADLGQGGVLSVDRSQQLTINGQLQINNGFVVAPTAPIANPVAGQIYFDKTTNALNYYNGSGYVPLTKSVNSLGSLTGDVGVGAGLGTTGATLVNTGVLGLQGRTGNLTLTAGNGIAINGLTISSTQGASITGITGGNGLAVTQSGSTVTVALPQRIDSGATPTFAGLQLSAPLGVGSGGTGASSLATGGLLVGNGAAPVGTITAGGPGLCLLSTVTTPVFGSCSGSASVTSVNTLSGGLTIAAGAGITVTDNGTDTITIDASGVASLDGIAGALTVANSTSAGTTITINDASTAAKGIASFNAADFSVAGGAVSLGTVGILKGGTGATTAAAARTNLQAASSGANSDISSLSGLSTALSVLQGGTGGTTPALARTNLSAAASGVNSDISSLTGLSTITPAAALTIGSTTQALTLQGNGSTVLTSKTGSFTATLNFIPPTSARTISLPDASGTVCLSSNNCAYAMSGSGVTSVDTLVGTLTINNTTGTAAAITIDDAAAGVKGIASFDATDFSVTAGDVVLATVAITKGGTGATTSAGARTALGAAKSGANSDITSITGLTTALSILQGGTGATTAAAARISLGAAASGANADITGLSALTSINPAAALTVGNTAQTLKLQGAAATTQLIGASGANKTTLGFAAPTAVNSIVIPNASGTVAVSASGAISLSAAGDITCLNCLTNNGTGGGSGVTDVNGISNSVSVLAGSGIAITNDVPGGTITIASSGGGVASVNGISGIISINNATTPDASHITIDDASTSAKGIAQFNAADFSVTGGLVSLGAGITRQGNTFNGGSQLVQLDASGAATVTGQCLVSTATGTAFATCPGSAGGGIFTGTSQTPGKLTKFDTVTNTITDSIASEAGSTLSVTGTLAATALTGGGSGITALNANNISTGTLGVIHGGTGSTTSGGARTNLGAAASGLNADITSLTGLATINPSGALTVGNTAQSLTLQGAASSTFSGTSGSFSTSLGFTAPTAARTISLPDASGVICLDSGNCPGGISGVSSVNLASGALTIAGTTNQVSVATVGNNITLSLPQDLDPSSSPTFANLTTNTIAATGPLSVGSQNNVTSIQGTSLSLNAYNGLFSTNFIFQGATGNATIVVPNQSGTVAVSASGNIALSGAGNITFTGTLPVTKGGSGAASFTANGILYGNGAGQFGVTTAGNAGECLISNGAIVNPTFQSCGSGANAALSNLSAVAINTALLPGTTGTIDLGSNTKAFQDLFLSDASDSFAYHFTGATTTQNKTINIPTFTGTTADLCLTTGNCAGSGTGVTSSSATANFIPLFSTAQNITNSILSQNAGATTLTVSGIAAITGALNASGGINTSNTNINAGSGTITGNGSALTSLNASNISSGTLNDTLLSSNVALLGRNSQVFTGNDQLFRNASNSATALQIQSQTNAPLLTADTSSMTVTVSKLVVGGNLTVNGHIITGGSAPSAIVNASAGTGASCTVSGTDTAGKITLVTGTGTVSAGTRCSLTFSTAFGATPHVIVSAASAVSAAIAPYASATSSSNFDLGSNLAGALSTSYIYEYVVAQ